MALEGEADGISARHVDGIVAWLSPSTGEEAEQLRAQMKEDPLRFFSSHLDQLPPHLSQLCDAVTTTQQRGTLLRIRDRRRRFAEAEQPAELSLREMRQREPLLWQRIVGRYGLETDAPPSTSRSGAQAAMIRQSPSTGAAADTNSAPGQTATNPVGSDPQDLLADTGKIGSLHHLMNKLDEEDVRERLTQQQNREAETVPEVETDSEEEDEDAEEQDTKQDAAHGTAADSGVAEFKQIMLDKYLRGDVSAAIHLRIFLCLDSSPRLPSLRPLAISRQRWTRIFTHATLTIAGICQAQAVRAWILNRTWQIHAPGTKKKHGSTMTMTTNND